MVLLDMQITRSEKPGDGSDPRGRLQAARQKVYVISVLMAAPLAIVLAYNRRIPRIIPYFCLQTRCDRL
jgi:hypothetical protein